MNENVPPILFELPGNQGNSCVYYTADGFFFHLNQTRNNIRYFRCTEWRNGCPTTAKVSALGVFSHSEPHSHDADISRIDYNRSRLELIDQFRNLNVVSVQNVFEDPQNFNLLQQFPTLTQHRLYPSMIRARENALPRLNNFVELNNILQDRHYLFLTTTQDMDDVLYRGSVQCDDGSCIILMLTNRCQEYFEMIPFVFIFSNEIQVLANQYQILTIACEWERNMIELAWILVENDVTDISLLRAFRYLKTCLRSCAITKAICASKRIAEAFAASFDVSVSHTLYDFIQWLKDFSLGFGNANYHYQKVIKLIAALPVLPKDLTQHGIEIIIEEAHRTGVYNDCQLVWSQIETHWLANPEEFSVFGSQLRTNFGVENHKHKLKQHFSRTADFYCVVRKIMMRVQKSHQRIQCIISGQKLQPRMPLPLSSEIQIINIVNNSLSQNLTSWNLLNIACQKLSHLI